MLSRPLGASDVRLSEIALGTWGLAAQSYGAVTPARFEATVQRALDVGVRTFDVAPHWGEDGASERVVGRLTASLRAECSVVTRAGYAREAGALVTRTSRAALVASCEASLARLGTDRVDLLLFQGLSEDTIRGGEPAEAASELLSTGKIRAWGACVGTALEARLALSAGAQALGLVHNVLASDLLDDLVADLAVSGAGVFVRSPLAYGLLAGAISVQSPFAEADHRARRWDQAALERRLAAVGQLGFLVRGAIRTPAEAALRFVLANEAVTSCAVGARSPAQIASAAAAATGAPYLPEEDRARIPQVLAALGL
jgi:aryl-alcohol dehydrogenase-like predicted oxidoreductase